MTTAAMISHAVSAASRIGHPCDAAVPAAMVANHVTAAPGGVPMAATTGILGPAPTARVDQQQLFGHIGHS